MNVGSSSSNTVTFTNSGAGNLTISQVNITGADFSGSGMSLPSTLSAGQSSALNVVFSPDEMGVVTGSLSVVSNAPSSPTVISLSGTGMTGLLTVNPASLTFGDVTLGSSPTQSVTLTNTGNQSLTITQDTLSNPAFSLTGMALPLTLTTGQSKAVTVQFTPTAAGRISDVLSLVSNTVHSPTGIALAGNGLSPGVHAANLAWDAGGANISSYVVYRASVPGGPYTRLTLTPIATPSYSDTSVEAGQVYFYVVTAISIGGVESLFSNETKATVPSP